jgi:putative flippase GtrA
MSNIIESKLTKSDIIVSLLIGSAAGWLLLIIINNISQTLPQVKLIPLWVWPVFFPLFCLVWFLLIFFLSKKWLTFYQFGKFVLVGGLNFLVDLGVLNLLIFFTGIAAGWFYSLFKGISFAVAVINSYFLNKFWTFKSAATNDQSVKKVGKEFLTFVVISVIGLGFNNLVASLLVNGLGPQWGISENVWANVGAVTASFLAMFWNFIGYKFIVFKK